MHRLYFDTCILNDFFALMQYELGEKVRTNDVKSPIHKWTPEYVALYYLLHLDDQWNLTFGTSDTTLQEIEKFQPHEQIGYEKKAFLEDVYYELSQNWQLFSEPVSKLIFGKVNSVLGSSYDSVHICRAIQNRWDFFITTDFKTILNNHNAVTELEKLIKLRSPLQFLEENLLPLPMLIRTLHGSWTNTDNFISTFGFSLDQLKH